MISSLEIKNFKSVKHLRLAPRRINVLIGKPNAGKSNILEALGLLSFIGFYRGGPDTPRDFVRFERTLNLFYDEVVDNPLEIRWDDCRLSFTFQQGRFTGEVVQGESSKRADFSGDQEDIHISGVGRPALFTPFKFYRFRVLTSFPQLQTGFLLPPSGTNLMSLILAHKDLRSLVNSIFGEYNLRLNLRPQEHKLEIIKQYEDISISVPYSLASDTLQRTVFYSAAIHLNSDSVLAFEEPEAHAFPFYTKQLAETIALDERNNQYFISTHNPYFLEPLLEKAPKEQVAVFLTYYKDHETRVKQLSEEDLKTAMEVDVFGNLDWFLGNE